MVYSWQLENWQYLQSAYHRQHLPHGLLFHGEQGGGTQDFCHHFTAFLVCDTRENNRACGHCQSCRLFAAKTHPDVVEIAPVEAGKPVTVDQVRTIHAIVYGTTQIASVKVVIIQAVDRMTLSAANSLLKILEEPPSDTIMLLLADRLDAVPITIQSRCQKLGFPFPDREQATAWLSQQNLKIDAAVALDMAGGAPLLAARYTLEDIQQYQTVKQQLLAVLSDTQAPLTLAAEWHKQDVPQILHWMHRIQASRIKNSNTPAHGFALYDALTEGRRLAGQSGINVRLLLERLLLLWQESGTW
jgi:DNA polymerase III subunit delta'